MSNTIDTLRDAVEGVLSKRAGETATFRIKTLGGESLVFLGTSRPRNIFKKGGNGRALVFGLEETGETTDALLLMEDLATVKNVVLVYPPRRVPDGRTVQNVRRLRFKTFTVNPSGGTLTFEEAGKTSRSVVII